MEFIEIQLIATLVTVAALLTNYIIDARQG